MSVRYPHVAERRGLILAYLESRDPAPIRVIANVLGLKESEVRNDIEALRWDGRVVRRGWSYEGNRPSGSNYPAWCWTIRR